MACHADVYTYVYACPACCALKTLPQALPGSHKGTRACLHEVQSSHAIALHCLQCN